MWRIKRGKMSFYIVSKYSEKQARKKESVSSPSWLVGHRCRTTSFVVVGIRFDASVLNSSQEHFWYKTIQGENKIADRLSELQA